MKAVKKALRRGRLLAFIFTFMLPAGGVLLGVGLGIGFAPMWAVGIAFLGLGFYGCPTAWAIGYSSAKQNYRLVSTVVEEHLYTVREIASQLSLSEKDVRSRLDTCFRKGYFAGYKREGDSIVPNDAVAPDARTYGAECPSCGAKFTYTAQDARCPYCGTPVRR